MAEKYWVDTIFEHNAKSEGIDKERYISRLITKMGKNKEYCVNILTHADVSRLGLDKEQTNDIYYWLLHTPEYVDIAEGYRVRLCSMNWYEIKDTLSYKISGPAGLSDALDHHLIRVDLLRVSNKCSIM